MATFPIVPLYSLIFTNTPFSLPIPTPSIQFRHPSPTRLTLSSLSPQLPPIFKSSLYKFTQDRSHGHLSLSSSSSQPPYTSPPSPPTMAPPAVSPVAVEDFVFPPSVLPPSTDKSFFLGGAGVRGLVIEGKFISFTAIGVYFDEGAVAYLSDKWKGKSATELAESVEFFRDIVTGPFEKFIQITMLKPLTGVMYSEKVKENCVAIWKAIGIYTEAEEKAIDKFMEIFKDQTFPPGTSILFKQCPPRSLRIAFGKHDAVPEADVDVIENGPLSQSVLESIIGKNGVSPAAKESIAARLHELLNPSKALNGEAETKENGVEIKE